MSLAARAIGTLGGDISETEQYKKSLQLGQIAEMIHVASLIHDDILDEASTRRGGSAVHSIYTNKVQGFQTT